ncbi:MAG TPA: tyrosinase family protein [Longimicrobiaceae bacterium]|nr:tyrosinase family protein [Longimicrobiaceae bacterium]
MPTFALPYWGYSPTGRRDLPEPFRWPPSPVTNPLFVPERDPSVNTGEPLRASAVDSGAAMPHTSFWSFQTALEGTPHGMVHVGVGGYMRLVETSALDPIFYLHHANIDRLWEVWLALGGGRENPTDSDWRNREFNFYDENGKTVRMKGDEIVRTAEQLAYRYIECSGALLDASEPTLVAQLQGDAALLAARIGRRPPLAEVQTLTALRTGSKLGARPAAMQVPLPPEAGDALRRFEEGTVGNDVVVHLQGIVLLEEPKVYYEVYANLSGAAGDTAYTSPHFVGNLDFFGIPKEDDTDHTVHGGNNRRLSLLRVYAFLRTRGLWSDQALTLTFIPRGYTEDVTPTAVLTTDQVYIDQVSVELR